MLRILFFFSSHFRREKVKPYVKKKCLFLYTQWQVNPCPVSYWHEWLNDKHLCLKDHCCRNELTSGIYLQIGWERLGGPFDNVKRGDFGLNSDSGVFEGPFDTWILNLLMLMLQLGLLALLDLLCSFFSGKKREESTWASRHWRNTERLVAFDHALVY